MRVEMQQQPFLVLALAAGMLVIGYRSLRNAPLDVFPEFAPPLVEIQTEAPGPSTEEVESLVTVPLENALNGTPDLKTMLSKAVLGLSSIVLIFQEGTNLTDARQLVSERLAIEASRLPMLIRLPALSVVALVGLLVGTLATVPYLGEEFLPNFQEYDFLMHWVEKPGTSIEAMDRIAARKNVWLRF